MANPNRLEFDINLDSVADIRCPINPIEVDNLPRSSMDFELNDTLDGEPVIGLPRFDGRIRTLTWRGLPNKTPYAEMISGFQILQYLISGCQINYRDLHANLGNNEWIPIRVVSLNLSFKPGAGSSTARNYLVYDKVEIQYITRANF